MVEKEEERRDTFFYLKINKGKQYKKYVQGHFGHEPKSNRTR
jgi:hypothetical protein